MMLESKLTVAVVVAMYAYNGTNLYNDYNFSLSYEIWEYAMMITIHLSIFFSELRYMGICNDDYHSFMIFLLYFFLNWGIWHMQWWEPLDVYGPFFYSEWTEAIWHMQ